MTHPLLLIAPLVALATVNAPPVSRPRLVASQGLRYHAPESTLPAFAAALDVRVGFQVTVRRSRDGKLIAFPDVEAARTTSGRGPIADLSLADLERLDAGSWFDREFAGERIPTLDEVLALVKQRRPPGRAGADGTLVVLDLQVDGMEAELGRLLARQGLAAATLCTGLPARDPAARRKLRAIAPRLLLAAAAARPQDLEAAIGASDADWVVVGFVPSVADAARVHKAGRRLLAAPTIAGYDPDLCARASEAQIDALLTDFPLECRALWRSAERR
jgi:glycerophosphoryl diester phosphodiesterase